MATCPKGHDSGTLDYCDTCGTPMGGTAPPPEVTQPVPEATATSPGAAPCPVCGTPRTGRFCEEDGYDFLLAPPVTPPAAPAGGGPPATGDPGLPDGGTGLPGGRTGLPGGGTGLPGGGTGLPGGGTGLPGGGTGLPDEGAGLPGGPGSGTGPGSVTGPRNDGAAPAPGTQAPSRLEVVVAADRPYFEGVIAQGGEDAGGMVFPRFAAERRFPLTGERLLIGRRSRSRGIHPEIDLGGAPEDPGVSHTHALLLNEGGTWSIVDLGSANGTYVNDPASAAIPAETPVPLRPGDRVYLGAWTSLTVRDAQ